MNLWIFVIKDSDDEFQNRIKNKQWPIYHKTRNRKKISIGDHVLFYKAGINGQRFLGNAIIKTNLKKYTMFDYFLELDEISIWKNSVLIKPLIPDLNFIINKNNWGVYFQGGVMSISSKDFNTITIQN